MNKDQNDIYTAYNLINEDVSDAELRGIPVDTATSEVTSTDYTLQLTHTGNEYWFTVTKIKKHTTPVGWEIHGIPLNDYPRLTGPGGISVTGGTDYLLISPVDNDSIFDNSGIDVHTWMSIADLIKSGEPGGRETTDTEKSKPGFFRNLAADIVAGGEYGSKLGGGKGIAAATAERIRQGGRNNTDLSPEADDLT